MVFWGSDRDGEGGGGGSGGAADDDDDEVMMRESKDDEGKDDSSAAARGYVLEIRTRPDLAGSHTGGPADQSGRARMWTPEFRVQGKYGAGIRETEVASLVRPKI